MGHTYFLFVLFFPIWLYCAAFRNLTLEQTKYGLIWKKIRFINVGLNLGSFILIWEWFFKLWNCNKPDFFSESESRLDSGSSYLYVILNANLQWSIQFIENVTNLSHIYHIFKHMYIIIIIFPTTIIGNNCIIAFTRHLIVINEDLSVTYISEYVVMNRILLH